MLHARRAFSIIELLIVVGLIVLLLALVLPGLGRVRESGRMVVCMSNLRQIGMATTLFSNDHRFRLPGIWGGAWVGGEDWQGCWLSNPESGGIWENAPQTGVVYPYVPGGDDAYRCPSLGEGVLGSGEGSNGRFDYSAWHAFAGARRTSVPRNSDLVLYGQEVSTPWISEESPYQHLNTSNIEGGFGGGDRMGNWHNGSGNYVAIDGSAHTLPNAKDLSTFLFYAKTPGNDYVHLGSHSSGWGGWQRR